MRKLAPTACAIVTGSILLLSAPVLLLVPSRVAGEPLKLGAPPSPRMVPSVPGTEKGVQILPAPENRAFVPPLSQYTRTGRAGVAVWGAPGTATSQRGPGDPDSVGWAGAGVAVEWGATPKGPRPN